MSETLQEKLSRVSSASSSDKGREEVKLDGTSGVVTKAPIEKEAKVERLYNVFYNTIKSCKTITDKGRTISFINGKYVTDVKEEIDYLEHEISLGNNHIYVKEGEEQLTSDELDPMKMLKKKHIAEYLADQESLAEAISKGKLPSSESDTQKLVPGSSVDIASLAEGSGT